MKLKSLLSLSLAVAFSTFIVACNDSSSKSDDQSNQQEAATEQAAGTTTAEASATITNLQTTDVKLGDGDEAVVGKVVSVHYTGWFYDPNAADKHGAKFDSSRDRGTPFEFPLGAGRVIQGWDQGVVGMKVGGQRTLIIPADLAYGARGAGGVIPPNATLVFDIELLAVK